MVSASAESARVGRTLLSDAVDVDLDFDVDREGQGLSRPEKEF